MTTAHPIARATGAVIAAASAAMLAACAPGIAPRPHPAGDPATAPDERPLPVDGAPPSSLCLDMFPTAGTVPDLAHYPAVPALWAQPHDVELCLASEVDSVATLYYATTLTPTEVADTWEPLLADYDVIRDLGLGEQPVLYATNAESAATVQPLDGGTILVEIIDLR